MVPLYLLCFLAYGAAGKETTPFGRARPLLGNVATECGDAEVWQVALPSGDLTPSSYIDACASVGLMPVCDGNDDCGAVSNDCVVLEMNKHAGACHHPLRALAVHLGFDDEFSVGMENMCTYMAPGLGWDDGACADFWGWRHGNDASGRRHVVCAGHPTVPNAFLTVSGSCQVNNNGTCLQSPHFPNPYGANEFCSVVTLHAGNLSVRHFDTEEGYDVLSVQGISYSGSHGPHNAVLKVGDVIDWSSDFDVSGKGWELCLESPPPHRPTNQGAQVNGRR